MSKLRSSKRSGVILSYILIIMQTISTMVLTNLYLSVLGKEMYGLYQMIYSIASYILILDLGISTVMVRFITEHDTKDNHERAENFAFHFGIILIFIIFAVYVIGVLVNNQIENIYTGLSLDEYLLSHKIFSVMIIQIIFTIIGHYFQGIAISYEQFTFVKSISVIQVVVSMVLTIGLLFTGMGVMAIVISNTVAICISVGVVLIYDVCVLKFKIRYHYLDINALIPAFVLMIALLLQSVVGYVNNMVDKTILGIMTTKADVAAYSIAATFITMFNSLPTAISNVFQPSVTKQVISGATNEELTDAVIKPGRFQFIVTGGFIAGFILFGKDFISCWVGEDLIDSWSYVILILVPNMIPLIQNVCLSILNAKNKRLFRSIILIMMTVVNIFLTVLLVKKIGAIGAPLATSISYIIGHCIIMNIYYKKVIGLNIKRMFKTIFKGTFKGLLITFIINVPLILWGTNGNWIVLIIKAIVFCCVYIVVLYWCSLTEDEKNLIQPILNKVKRIVF